MSRLIKAVRRKYVNFRSKYIVQQRRPYEYAINRYYAHLIDPFFTKLVYDLRFTPNLVTILNGLVGVAVGVSFLFQHWLLGGILLQLHHYLDGADGNLARLTNRCTPLGAKLDRWSDQIVRYVLFISLAVSVDLPLWARIALPVTMVLDVWIVHYYVLPFARKHQLVRAKWKQWFLDRGIIPGVDIFTVFFIITVCALFNSMSMAVFLVLFLKNLDWIYRVWECLKTSMHLKTEVKRL